MKIIQRILDRSIKIGLILAVFGLIFSLILRFHMLLVFVPQQAKQSGGFWNYFMGSGEYNWYLADPIGLILFLLCSIPSILGLILIFGGLYFDDKIQSKIDEEVAENFLHKMKIRKKEVGPKYKKIKKKGKTKYIKI